MTCRSGFFCYKSWFKTWKILSFCFFAKNNPPDAELACDSDSSIWGIDANAQKTRIFTQVSQCV